MALHESMAFLRSVSSDEKAALMASKASEDGKASVQEVLGCAVLTGYDDHKPSFKDIVFGIAGQCLLAVSNVVRVVQMK